MRRPQLPLLLALAGASYFLQAAQAPPAAKPLEEPLETDVVTWLKPHLEPREPLLALSDARLYMATNTLPATRLLYVFPWMYDGALPLDDLERSRPRFAVWYPDIGDMVDAETLGHYLAEHYEPVFAFGDVEVLRRRES